MVQSNHAPRAPESTAVVELRRRQRELAILQAIAEALNATADLDGSLRNTLNGVTDLLELRTGWIWLLDDASGEPYLAAAKDLPKGLAEHPARMEGSCHCLDKFRSGGLTGAANVSVLTCSRLKWLKEGTEGLRYHASVPIYAHGRRLGVLNVAAGEWRRLNPDDLRILHTVGEMLGVAIERAHLYDRSAETGAVEERNRIAREIHDTLAQGLSAIALHLDSADAILTQENGSVEAAVPVIRDAMRITQECLEEARRTILDLRAASLEGRTLPEALAFLVEDVGSRHSPTIELTVTGAFHPLATRIEAGLFRIAQEGLANALDHADPEHIVVELITMPSEVTLSIADDGNGFDPKEVDRGRFGLVGMRERAMLLGGTLELDSNPRTGTGVRVRIPRIPPGGDG